jgi:hypothetical protein
VSQLQLLWNIDPFPLYNVPATHGISNPWPMVFRSPSHGILPPSPPLSFTHQTTTCLILWGKYNCNRISLFYGNWTTYFLLIKNEGVQHTIRMWGQFTKREVEGSICNKVLPYKMEGVNIPWSSKFHITDTGINQVYNLIGLTININRHFRLFQCCVK